jgi:hypothetical protein
VTGSRPPRPRRESDPGPCATAASVAGLARELEAVRRRVADFTAVPGRVDELAVLVARLAEDLAAVPAPEAERSEPSWLNLPADATPIEATTLLLDLVAWIGGVYLRYPDGARGLPGCWLWHPHVVEELLWLRRAWIGAYSGPKSSPAAVGDWHDRLRPGVARRIQQTAGTCSVENHQPGRTPLPEPDAATGGVRAGAAVEPIAFWWAVNRDAEAPAPTGDQLAAAAESARPRGPRRSTNHSTSDRRTREATR